MIEYTIEECIVPEPFEAGQVFGISPFGDVAGQAVSNHGFVYQGALWTSSDLSAPVLLGPLSGPMIRMDKQQNSIGWNGTSQALVDLQGIVVVNLTQHIGQICTLHDINNSQKIVGSVGSPSRAYIYDVSSGDLAILPFENAFGSAINDSGDVVGNWGEIAFLYSGSLNVINILPSTPRGLFLPSDVNSHQLVVGDVAIDGPPGSTYGGVLPVILDASVASPVLTFIGTPSGFPSASAWAINESGTVVGGANTIAILGSVPQTTAWVWKMGDPLQATDLNQITDPTAGWNLQGATDINTAGQIVGYGLHNGRPAAFRLSPILPPPRRRITSFTATNEPPNKRGTSTSAFVTGVGFHYGLPVEVINIAIHVGSPEGPLWAQGSPHIDPDGQISWNVMGRFLSDNTVLQLILTYPGGTLTAETRVKH